MSSFEERLNKLETICEKMSSEGLSLEQGLKLYEEGVKIAKLLERELTGAERKVEQLLNENFGDTDAKPRLQLFEEHAEATQNEADSQ